MGAVVHGGAEGVAGPEHPPRGDRDGHHERQAHPQGPLHSIQSKDGGGERILIQDKYQQSNET